jgi:putative transcriptional regulator
MEETMGQQKNNLSEEILNALGEVQEHMAGKVALPYRVAEVPNHIDVKKIRQKFGYTQVQFASHFGFSTKSVKEWEQGRRTPERAARILLTIIDQEPHVVERALYKFT